MSAKSLVWKLLPLPAMVRIHYGAKYWLFGEWELRELPGLLPDRGMAIDVGANTGYYSYGLKRMGQSVISFEPNPIYQKRLRALLGDRARIEMVALSSGPGSGVMRVPYVRGAYGGSTASLSDVAVPEEVVSSRYEVELRTLDSYNFDNVAFIKIDVEGHEEAVLAGAADTLNRSKPVLLIEIEERHNPGGLDRIVKSLSMLGYSGFFFYERERYDLSEFVPKIHQAAENFVSGKINTRAVKYVNNFIFEVS